MGVLIDSSVLVAFERGDLDTSLVTEESAISVITISEVLHGVHRASGDIRLQRQAAVEYLLGQFEEIDITEQIARIHAAVAAELASRGEIVGAHDLWIGATGLAYGLGVMTRNQREFARIPGLRVLTV